jgi:ribosomal protein S18 acetylase RimI-like enzyme
VSGVGSTEPPESGGGGLPAPGAGITIHRATEADEPVLRELWEEFEREVPLPPELVETWDEEWQDIVADIGGRGLVLLADDEDGVAGGIRATMRGGSVWHVSLAYVRPRARRRGVLRALLRETVRVGRERGSQRVTLSVLSANEIGVATWRALGFEPLLYRMATTLDALEQRLDTAPGETFGSIHVQTDDRDAVLRAVDKYRPRLAGPGGTEVSEPRNGWVSVYDELCQREPALLQRLAKELSYATGAVVVEFTVEREAAVGYAIFDHGSSVDDYLSVPEFRGPLPPGDVVALAANPRVVQRLTGADPAVVRAVARNASSPSELPPARELVSQIAAAMGIADADRGYAG